METLFDIPKPVKYENPNKCRNCGNAQKWQCNSKYFFYYGVRASNRTENKLLKIKLKNDACQLWEDHKI